MSMRIVMRFQHCFVKYIIAGEAVRKEIGASSSEKGIGAKLGLPHAAEFSGSVKKGQTRTTERSIKYDISLPKASLDELVRADISLLGSHSGSNPSDFSRILASAFDSLDSL